MVLFLASALGWLGYLLSEPQQKQDQADHYLDSVVKAGVIATIFWGVVGFCIWAIHSQQYKDPEGDARRILDNRFDERPLSKQDDNQGDEAHNS